MDLEAFYILTADIDDKLNVGHKILCRGKVSDCLNNAVVNAKGVLYDILAVAGNGGRGNCDVRINLVDFLQKRLDDLNRVALGGKIF